MAPSQSSRARRFALPNHADERTGESIEAFLTGPQRRRGRPADPSRSSARAVDPLVALDNRLSWNEALRRESARARRYRRPAAVVVVAAMPGTRGPEVDGWHPRLVGPIAHVIRRGARETDLVTRATDTRFQVLLPETTEVEAAHFAERVVADCDVWLRAIDAPVIVRAAAAGQTQETTLEDALARAVEAVDPGTAA